MRWHKPEECHNIKQSHQINYMVPALTYSLTLALIEQNESSKMSTSVHVRKNSFATRGSLQNMLLLMVSTLANGTANKVSCRDGRDGTDRPKYERKMEESILFLKMRTKNIRSCCSRLALSEQKEK